MGCLGITKWDFNSEVVTDGSANFQGFERQKSYAETSGKFCKEMRFYAEFCDRLFQVGRGISEIGGTFSTHEGWSTANSLTASASATLSALRSLLSLEQLVSGDFIEEKDVIVKGEKQTTTITTAAGEQKIPQKTTDWLGTASNVFLAVGRFFNTAVWFGKAKIIDLGKHAKWVGGVVTGAFAIGITLFTLQQGRDLIEGVNVLRHIEKETDRKEYEEQLWAVKQKISWVFCGVSDMVEFPSGMFAPPLFAGIAKVGAGCTWLVGQYIMAG